jgi:hypothetical protein
MQLKPGLTADHAYAMLAAAAAAYWGEETAATLETQLKGIAEAMEVIGNMDIPDDTEPLFGEDGAEEEMQEAGQ